MKNALIFVYERPSAGFGLKLILGEANKIWYYNEESNQFETATIDYSEFCWAVINGAGWMDQVITATGIIEDPVDYKTITQKFVQSA